ncbi:hypothetical protein HDU76_000354 [Blyttiomyces sp. JEL0837]|nr:hypothetical protein HDU76_000354 [Blyttiomyces sp. JEL0837]
MDNDEDEILAQQDAEMMDYLNSPAPASASASGSGSAFIPLKHLSSAGSSKQSPAATTSIINEPAAVPDVEPNASIEISINIKEDSPNSPIKQVKKQSYKPPADLDTGYCPICLTEFDDWTMLPSCFHAFCHECILQWANVSRSCPLCKRGFSECFHDFLSDRDYRKYIFPPLSQANSIARVDAWGHPTNTSTRTTRRTHPYTSTEVRRRLDNARRHRYHLSEHEASSGDQLRMSSFEKRRYIYQHGLYAKHVGSTLNSRYRNGVTPEMFKKDSGLRSRVMAWVRRELQVLMRDYDVEFLRDFVVAVMERFDLQTERAVQLLRPYFMEHTEHFVHELICFCRSPFAVDAYDKVVQYDEFPTDADGGISKLSWNRKRGRQLVARRGGSDDDEVGDATPDFKLSVPEQGSSSGRRDCTPRIASPSLREMSDAFVVDEEEEGRDAGVDSRRASPVRDSKGKGRLGEEKSSDRQNDRGRGSERRRRKRRRGGGSDAGRGRSVSSSSSSLSEDRDGKRNLSVSSVSSSVSSESESDEESKKSVASSSVASSGRDHGRRRRRVGKRRRRNRSRTKSERRKGKRRRRHRSVDGSDDDDDADGDGGKERVRTRRRKRESRRRKSSSKRNRSPSLDSKSVSSEPDSHERRVDIQKRKSREQSPIRETPRRSVSPIRRLSPNWERRLSGHGREQGSQSVGLQSRRSSIDISRKRYRSPLSRSRRSSRDRETRRPSRDRETRRLSRDRETRRLSRERRPSRERDSRRPSSMREPRRLESSSRRNDRNWGGHQREEARGSNTRHRHQTSDHAFERSSSRHQPRNTERDSNGELNASPLLLPNQDDHLSYSSFTTASAVNSTATVGHEDADPRDEAERLRKLLLEQMSQSGSRNRSRSEGQVDIGGSSVDQTPADGQGGNVNRGSSSGTRSGERSRRNSGERERLQELLRRKLEKLKEGGGDGGALGNGSGSVDFIGDVQASGTNGGNVVSQDGGPRATEVSKEDARKRRRALLMEKLEREKARSRASEADVGDDYGGDVGDNGVGDHQDSSNDFNVGLVRVASPEDEDNVIQLHVSPEDHVVMANGNAGPAGQEAEVVNKCDDLQTDSVDSGGSAVETTTKGHVAKKVLERFGMLVRRGSSRSG